MAFSPDLKFLVTGNSCGQNPVTVWDIATGQPVRHFDPGESVTFVAMLPDGKRLVCGTYHGPLALYDLTTGKDLYAFYAYRDGIAQGVLSADGLQMLTFGFDGKGLLKLWDANTGNLIRQFEPLNVDLAYSLVLSPDSKLALTATRGELDAVRLWDLPTGKLLRTMKRVDGWSGALAFAPDGKNALLFSGGQFLIDWAIASGEILARYPLSWRPPGPLAGAFSSNGREIMAASKDEFIVRERSQDKDLWSLSLGSEERPVSHVAFSHDGTRLAVATGYLLEGHTGGGTDVLGRIAEIGIEVWDIPNRRLLKRWFDVSMHRPTVPSTFSSLNRLPMKPWNLVFLIAFIAYMGIRAVFERRTRGNEKAISRVDWRDRILLSIVLLGSILLPAAYLFTPWLAFADYRLPAFVPWCGTAVMVGAIWLFWRSHADLGQNWSVTLELRKGHQLINDGVYRSIRHPMYASIWLFTLGQGLLLENWLAGWSALVTFALLYFVRTPREEQMMCDNFGQEYQDYMRQTGRLFPRLFIR